MSGSAKGLSRAAAEAVAALALGAFGATVMLGSFGIGIGWGDFGPASGTFPFWVGFLILAGSAVNLWRAFTAYSGDVEPFLDGRRLRLVASFLLPVIAFLLLALFLGIYVAAALYVAGAMRFQGGYGWPKALAVGIGLSAILYVLFEIVFQVPLLKGPIEAWLGVY